MLVCWTNAGKSQYGHVISDPLCRREHLRVTRRHKRDGELPTWGIADLGMLQKLRRARRQTANFRDRYAANGVMLWRTRISLRPSHPTDVVDKGRLRQNNFSKPPIGQPGQKQAP
jgi:hypothetical protein